MKLKFLDDEWDELLTHCGFTDNEVEVVKYLRRGWYGADISAELNISWSTFKRRKKGIEERIIKYMLKTGW